MVMQGCRAMTPSARYTAQRDRRISKPTFTGPGCSSARHSNLMIARRNFCRNGWRIALSSKHQIRSEGKAGQPGRACYNFESLIMIEASMECGCCRKEKASQDLREGGTLVVQNTVLVLAIPGH